ALVDSMPLLIEISRTIWACEHAGLAADAFIAFHHDNSRFLVLYCRLCRARPDARGVVALVAEHGNEFPFPAYRVRNIFFEYPCAIAVGGHVVSHGAGVYASFAIDAPVLPYDHTVMRLIWIFFCRLLRGSEYIVKIRHRR